MTNSRNEGATAYNAAKVGSSPSSLGVDGATGVCATGDGCGAVYRERERRQPAQFNDIDETQTILITIIIAFERKTFILGCLSADLRPAGGGVDVTTTPVPPPPPTAKSLKSRSTSTSGNESLSFSSSTAINAAAARAAAWFGPCDWRIFQFNTHCFSIFFLPLVAMFSHDVRRVHHSHLQPPF